MKKVFITGITGFAGGYLAEHLSDIGNFNISGTYLSDESVASLKNSQSFSLHKVNLLDEEATNKALLAEKPDYLFHLAAATSPKESFNNPKDTFINNVSSQLNILESVKKNGFMSTRILVVSSSEVYGLVSRDNLPMDEGTPFMPTNPYAVSKLSQDFLALQYFLSQKMDIVRVRPFNHVGPRQSPQFVVSAFAKRIADIEKGKESIMKVGNLDSKRDFSDVRDMVKAYFLAVEKGKSGDVYNLGSGKSYQISQVLEMLVGMSKVEIKTETDESLLRPTDDTEHVCDFSKFKALTGWQPEIPIEKTLEDTLEYWRGIN